MLGVANQSTNSMAQPQEESVFWLQPILKKAELIIET